VGYEFDWLVLLTYKQLLIDGFIMTIKLSIIGIFFAFLIGSFVGLAKVSKNFFISLFATYYIEFFRNIPQIVQMFFYIFFFYNNRCFSFFGNFWKFNWYRVTK
jgi:His/Glu/Gln/Arg/opine family amino acid ABC transporter permease subunit